MFIAPATWEAEAEGIPVQGKPRELKEISSPNKTLEVNGDAAQW